MSPSCSSRIGWVRISSSSAYFVRARARPETRERESEKMNSTSPVPLRQPLVRGQPSALSHPSRFPRLLPSFLSARRLLPSLDDASFVRLVRRGPSFSLPLFSLPEFPISRTGRSSSRSRIQRVAPELLLARFTFQAFDEPFRLFASRPKELSNAHETRRRVVGVPSDFFHHHRRRVSRRIGGRQ